MAFKLLAVFMLTLATSNLGSSSRFVGVGYNLYKGNPDGKGDGTSVGTDPGIKTLRRILDVTDSNSLVTSSRDVCKTTETIYENSQKYQQKLMKEVDVESTASFGDILSFSASHGFQKTNEETSDSESVIYEKIIFCNKGSERFSDSVTETYNFSVDETFAADICRLPDNYENHKDVYKDFFDTWGTHVITKVILGTKNIEKKQTSRMSLLTFAETNHASSISAGGSIGAFAGSLSVDYSQYESEENFKALFQSNMISFQIGTDSLPEPIGMTIESTGNFLHAKYWTRLADWKNRNICPTGFNLAVMFSRIEQALKEYPSLIETYPIGSEKVQVPLVWPEGTFGLLADRCEKTVYVMDIPTPSGRIPLYWPLPSCPSGTWEVGARLYHTDEDSTFLTTTKSECLGLHFYDDNFMVYLDFCMKQTLTGKYRRNWPKGSYCIFKKGNCPNGFTDGFINLGSSSWGFFYNKKYGYLPDGYYDDWETKMYFCCRQDAFPTEAIYLPTELSFVLFPKTSHCQKVNGMVDTEVGVYIDGEQIRARFTNAQGGSAPYNENRQQTLKLCYYKKNLSG